MTTIRGPAKLISFDELKFSPRFEHGEMAQLAEVSGCGDGTELGVGFARMTGARIPWTVQYDEVLIVLEGELTVRIGNRALTAGPRDSIWLPKGTRLTYDAEYALVTYAIHPANWSAPAASDDE